VRRLYLMRHGETLYLGRASGRGHRPDFRGPTADRGPRFARLRRVLEARAPGLAEELKNSP